MALLDYSKHTDKTTKLVGTIPSGVKSGDSSAELMIVEPLVEHPEIKGLYRAIDNTTGWRGWVEYTPVVVEPEPTQPDPQAEAEANYNDKLNKFYELKKLVDAGVVTAEEVKLVEKKAILKNLYTQLNT